MNEENKKADKRKNALPDERLNEVSGGLNANGMEPQTPEPTFKDPNGSNVDHFYDILTN